MSPAHANFFVTLFFLTGLVLYSYYSVLKFRTNKISVSVEKDFTNDTLLYPSVTLCSGFRDGRFTPEQIAKAAVEEGRGDGDPALLGPERMREITYDRGEFVHEFTQAFDNDWSTDYSGRDGPWTEQFHEYYGGRCYTFSPERETLRGEMNSLAFKIRIPERGYYDGCDGYGKHRCSEQFAIFLHPEGGFIYNKAPKFFGRSLIYPEFGKRLKFLLSKKKFKKISLENVQCATGMSTSQWKECVHRAYDKMAGCTLPWKTRVTSRYRVDRDLLVLRSTCLYMPFVSGCATSPRCRPGSCPPRGGSGGTSTRMPPRSPAAACRVSTTCLRHRRCHTSPTTSPTKITNTPSR